MSRLRPRFFFFVIGPDSRILVRQFLEDDGITGGDFKHQDGIYDPFADFRYRQWHRANSPGGMPAHKTPFALSGTSGKTAGPYCQTQGSGRREGNIPGGRGRSLGSLDFGFLKCADADRDKSRGRTFVRSRCKPGQIFLLCAGSQQGYRLDDD